MAEKPVVQETQERSAAAEMLGRVKSLHAKMQEAMGQVIGSSAEARVAEIIANLAGIEGQLTQAVDAPGGARGIDLAAIETLLRGGETAASAALEVASAEIAGRASQNLATASTATRHEVEGLSQDLFQRRIFDPYLHFGSAEDEADYRAREAERQQAIAAQLALHTPEGDLAAGGLTAGQMLDAHEHGAGASPEFLPRWNKLVSQLHEQRAAMLAAGHSTQEFDQHLVADVRTFLKAKGLSDAEIDARLAAAASPFDVVQSFMANDRDARGLEKMVVNAARAHEQPTSQIRVERDDGETPPPAAAEIDFSAMSAKLRAAGVQMAETPPPPSGHGLAVSEAAAKPGVSVVN